MARAPGRPEPAGRLDDLAVVSAAAGVVVLFVAVEFQIAGGTGLPLDDGWIHLRFAENLAAGRGFAINPGEPVAGSTAPLWTLLLAFAIALGLPALVAAKVLGLGCYAMTGLLTRRLALAAGLSRGLALAAGVGVVGLGRLGWGALSGMEVCLAAALVAGGALLVARERALAGAAVLGLATLARPEAGLLLLLHSAGARRLRLALARVGVGAAVWMPALAFNLVTVGRPVPGPAVAKVEGGLLGYLVGVPESWSTTWHRAAQYATEWARLVLGDHVALPLLILGGLVALRRSPLRWLGWGLVLHPVAMALVAPYRGPAFQTGRYSTHLVPLAVVVGVAGLGALLAVVPRGLGLRAAAMAAAALMLALPLGRASQAYAWGVQNINAMQVRLGRWAARETPPGALLAVNDVGAIAYFGDRPLIDLMGLVTPDIVSPRRRGEAGLLGYLERACPDYLVIFPAWFPGLAARTDLFRPIERVRLDHNLVSGAEEMVVYETVWNRWARPRAPCLGGPVSALRP